jgi:hypothetical protein
MKKWFIELKIEIINAVKKKEKIIRWIIFHSFHIF